MNRIFQGTGLGLSVSKKFVELMNGEMTVKSKVDEGTTFLMKFPAE
jgi:signal transduction histidine kinase